MTRVMVTMAAIVLAVPALAQDEKPRTAMTYRNAHPGAQGDTLGSIKRLPDWRGVWGLDEKSFAEARQRATDPKPNPLHIPLNAEFEAKRLANGAANGGHGPDKGTDNNASKCIPSGFPGIMQAPFAFEFLVTPGQVTIVPESGEVRRIYTDGRPHPANLDPTFDGHSIGWWEGDTLVIDTVGMKPTAEITMGIKQTGNGHVVERIRRISPDQIENVTTMTDPGMFTAPYKYRLTYLRSNHDMIDYFCTENNRDSNGDIDLTPPPEEKPAR